MPQTETMRMPRPWFGGLELAAETANKETRTVETVFYSGASVMRFSWEHGKYMLTLDTGGKVRLGQLNSGRAPVLETHSDWSTRDVLGVVESAEIKGGKGVATMRFARDDEDADRAWRKIEQGILRNVSMGVMIHKLKETTKEGETTKSFLATDWEPFEISIVPIGADPGAHIKMSAAEEIEVEILRAENPNPEKEALMPTEPKPGEQARIELEQVNPDKIRNEAVLAERLRRSEIMQRAKPFLSTAQLTAEFVNGLIDNGTSTEDAGKAILTELAKASEKDPPIRHQVRVEQDERDKFRLAMTAGLAHRAKPGEKLEDEARQFSGLTMIEMARECLSKAGANPRLHSRAEIAEAALNLQRLAGMHSTSDFPLILANVANKTLLGAYAYANPTYRMWTSPTTAPDFKTISRLRLGEAPIPTVVKEGGEITFGTMTESREQYALATYGKRVAITRQALINDDLSAFQRIIPAMGVQISRLENATVYAILTANAAMGDAVALFHANHGNLAGSGAAISITTLDAARSAMMVQTGLDGLTRLNVVPRYLIVPAAKLTVAQQYTTEAGIFPAVQTNINPFAGKLTPIADAELDANSTTAWYLATDASFGTVEYCFLEGNSGPRVMTREGWEVEGTEIKIVHDFAAKATDWRGLYKNAGA